MSRGRRDEGKCSSRMDAESMDAACHRPLTGRSAPKRGQRPPYWRTTGECTLMRPAKVSRSKMKSTEVGSNLVLDKTVGDGRQAQKNGDPEGKDSW